jgi:hypothetical protein
LYFCNEQSIKLELFYPVIDSLCIKNALKKGIMSEQTFIIQTVTPEQESALKAFVKALKMKFEVTDKPYNAEFVAKIEKSKKQALEGKVTRVEKENLKEFLGL